jgi:hypothetical protein
MSFLLHITVHSDDGSQQVHEMEFNGV